MQQLTHQPSERLVRSPDHTSTLITFCLQKVWCWLNLRADYVGSTQDSFKCCKLGGVRIVPISKKGSIDAFVDPKYAKNIFLSTRTAESWKNKSSIMNTNTKIGTISLNINLKKTLGSALQFKIFLLAMFIGSTGTSELRIVNINEHPGCLPRSCCFFSLFTPDPWLGSLISSAFSLVGGRSFDRGNELRSQAPRTT